MPALNALVLPVGRQGRQGVQGTTGAIGPTGPQGPQGASGFSDAPSNGTTYGRAVGSWQPILPLSGGTMSGGINFGNIIAGSQQTITSHLALYGTTYGFCITGGTLNYVAPTYHRFHMDGNIGMVIFAGSGSNTIYFSASFTAAYLSFTKTTGNLNFYCGAGLNANWNPETWNYGKVYATNEFWVGGTGFQYINWRWDGRILVRYNNQFEWEVPGTCDERMKQDIIESNFDAIGTIRRIRLYQYRWRSRERRPLMPIGFVAQRLSEDFPEGALVRKEKFKGATFMGTADQNTMLATACRAIQQLDKRIQSLKNQGI